MGQKFDKTYAERVAAFNKKKKDKTATADEPVEKKKRDLSREVAPGLTLGQLIAQTRASTQLKYGEAATQLKAQPKKINDWYGQYQAAIASASKAQAANYAGAVQGVQNLQTGLDQASEKQWAGQSAAMGADAANRGATVNPELADTAHNASNVRNVLTGSYGAMLASQGATENTYLGKRKVNAGVGKVEALKQNAQQRQQLAKDRGSFRQTVRAQTISDAASTALKNALTASTIGEQTADTQETKAKTQKTKAEIAFLGKYGRYPSTTDPNSTSAQLDKEKLKYFREHGYFPKAGPTTTPAGGDKDAYGNTPKQQVAAQDAWNEAWSLAKTYGKELDSEAELYQFLLSSKDVNSTLARAAARAYFNGGRVGAGMRKNLKKRGVTNFPKIKPKPTETVTPVHPNP